METIETQQKEKQEQSENTHHFLSSDLINYCRHIHNLFSDQNFHSSEELKLIVQNFYQEILNNEVHICKHRITSIVIEKIINNSSFSQFLSFFSTLSNFISSLLIDRCSSHVLQTIISRSVFFLSLYHDPSFSSNLDFETIDEESYNFLLELLIKIWNKISKISKFFYYASHCYATHIFRDMIRLFSGDLFKKVKNTNIPPILLTQFRRLFIDSVENWKKRSLENELFDNVCFLPWLQSVLQALFSLNCQKILHSYIKHCLNWSDKDNRSLIINKLALNSLTSHLMQVTSDKIFRKIIRYSLPLLISWSSHSYGKFVVQTLLSSIHNHEEYSIIQSKILSAQFLTTCLTSQSIYILCEICLCLHKFGIIDNHIEFIQILCQYFSCTYSQLYPSICSLNNGFIFFLHILYFHNNSFSFQILEGIEADSFSNSIISSKKHTLFLKNLFNSHCSLKYKRKIMKLLLTKIFLLAKSLHGSTFLIDCFECLDFKMHRVIAIILNDHISELSTIPHSQKVLSLYQVEYCGTHRQEWKKHISHQISKRKMFSFIHEDQEHLSKYPKTKHDS